LALLTLVDEGGGNEDGGKNTPFQSKEKQVITGESNTGKKHGARKVSDEQIHAFRQVKIKDQYNIKTIRKSLQLKRDHGKRKGEKGKKKRKSCTQSEVTC